VTSIADARPATAQAMSPAMARSLDAVNSVLPWCAFGLGTPATAGDWDSCAEALADPDYFRRWQRDLAGWLQREHGVGPPITAAGYVMGLYAAVFGTLGGALFQMARRVPSLAPENLAFRMDPDSLRPCEVILLDRSFRCLADDPAAGSPEATVVADERRLAAALRAEVAGHGAAFVAALRPSVRFGRHMLWAAVTDALDRGVWRVAAERGEHEQGAADAALVLPARLAPFTSGSTVRRLRAPDGRWHWTRARQSCCFYYKLPGVDQPCVTCPRLSDRQRAELLGRSGREI